MSSQSLVNKYLKLKNYFVKMLSLKTVLTNALSIMYDDHVVCKVCVFSKATNLQ